MPHPPDEKWEPGESVRRAAVGPGDAATPFSGSLEVRRRYPRASLIATRGGTTHAKL
jgi:hypothetical protein